MATYYVELDGGQLTPDAALKGGTMSAAVLFSGAVIYPSAGGGGGGNMQTKSVSYTPTESAISDAVTPDPGYDGMDRVNVSVGAIPSDYVGSDIPLCDSSDVETTITDTTFIRSHSVDVADGYYEDPVSLLNPFGTATFSPVGTPYVDPSTGDLTVQFKADTAGMAYTKSSYSITDEGAFNVKGAQTYTPGTTDQTIASGQYLTGNQTILGDANLIASNIVSGVTIFGVTGTAQTGGGWVEETISTSGAVTKALDPYTLYHFTGTLTSLTITLNAPSAGEIAHYHFDFLSGSTAPTLTMPNTVTMPDSFAVETSKRYEVDVLNNYGSVIAWTE